MLSSDSKSFKQLIYMENTEKTINTLKTWSDPELTILSVKNDTLGDALAGGDATTLVT